MDLEIVYSEPALAELEEIINRSWDRHPESTPRFASSLLNHVDLLRGCSRLGAPVKGHPGVRRFFHSPFHVYYRLHSDRQIEILHFWHRARKPMPLLIKK